ncbi:MAG: helix-hairpin-helix domain-containing protein [Dysgonamonadaceae bacterium]|jgi:DNA uptake protein ComE-like DNA-binding protein|nr:helix-hairpin-helix domain-containing protein [Dysgonamonadaceae bacterium]
MWKDFFYFSKREKQGILILIALIAGVFIGKFLFTPKSSHSEASNIPGDTVFVKKTEQSYSGENRRSYEKEKPKNNYSRPKPEEKRTYYQQPEKTVEPPQRNSYPQKEKFAEGTVIELNASDTSQLMKIPGIGTSFAKRISSYKKLLGGYYRLQQLQEVYGMYEELYDKIIPYLRVDTALIQPLPVNSASLDRLKSHPYLNFYQAKAIIEIRKKKGKINSINELAMLEEFSGEEDIERLRHYLKIEN